MAKGGYRGGSSVVGGASEGYREALKPAGKIKVPREVRLVLKRQDKVARRAEKLRRSVIAKVERR